MHAITLLPMQTMYIPREFYYRIGDCKFCVKSPLYNESDFLRLFSTEKTETPDLNIEINISPEKLNLPTGDVLIIDDKIIYHENGCEINAVRQHNGDILFLAKYNKNRIECVITKSLAENLNTFTLLEILNLPAYFLNQNALILHSSFIKYNDGAILFAAPKQTGKSTQAELWRKYLGAEIINGDRSLIKLTEDGLFAYGLPYCGTSKICKNEKIPVKGIVLLSQGKDNKIQKPTKREIILKLMSLCTFENTTEEKLNRFMDLLDKIATQAPFYSLSALPDYSAVEALKKVLD